MSLIDMELDPKDFKPDEIREPLTSGELDTLMQRSHDGYSRHLKSLTDGKQALVDKLSKEIAEYDLKIEDANKARLAIAALLKRLKD